MFYNVSGELRLVSGPLSKHASNYLFSISLCSVVSEAKAPYFVSFSLFSSAMGYPQVPFGLQGFNSLFLVCYHGGFSVDNFVLVQHCLSACLLCVTKQL